ncbi:RNA-directed DNA polymerase from mobile element jockey [Eumeta japonica]|uniref:RNA-directed DNA polymerase from mobile element jockey n=1 Tax=Eumeta variegata TaxID=151549 RepID=A0A4C1WXJ7_EUMVA|nr:RNA-directed DNA polymerase from mobile element jockey [Eumeta japonica]
MEEITSTYKAYRQVDKALKSDGYEPVPALKNPDNTLAFEDREKLCLANSIERQCSHTCPPHYPLHTCRVEEKVCKKVSLDPKDDLDPVMLDEVKGIVKNLKTRKPPGLNGISNKAIKCFSSSLLAFLVAMFNACLKNCYFPEVWKDAVIIGIPKPGKPRDLPASYRPISILNSLGIQLALFVDDTTLFLHSASFNHIVPRLQRANDELTQWFQLWRIEVNSDMDHIQRVRKLAIFYMSRLSGMIGRKSKMSLRNKRTLYTMCIRPVMTYACPIFLTLPRLHFRTFRPFKINFVGERLAHNGTLRTLSSSLQLPTLFKYMKDASERIFSIAINHPNPLMSPAASYEAIPANHFLRRTWNVLLDPSNDFTVERYLKVPTRVVTLRDSLCREDPSVSPVGESHGDGIFMSIGRSDVSGLGLGADHHGRQRVAKLMVHPHVLPSESTSADEIIFVIKSANKETSRVICEPPKTIAERERDQLVTTR